MKAIDQIVFVMGGAAIPSHLRQPRQPRLGGMPAPIAAVDFPEQFVRRARAGGMGARADDAHIALEHVEELRQFVDTGFADDRSAARYHLVASGGGLVATGIATVGPHSAAVVHLSYFFWVDAPHPPA